MKVWVAAVGKPRDAALAAAIREYEGRAARYWPLEPVEVKEESARSASGAVVMRKEGERLLERLPATARLVLCDPGGEALDSRAFAALLQEQRERAQDVAFVIGGAHGIGDVVRARPHRRLALAPWTLPHELARLVLAEQLYRAGTIVRNEPYHK
ncbi:MAG: 23S rRNA (pseudouridine(1915)-N(3))-methyltransferase RlmH [Gemmatimonadaceae bacterium]|nr:23S rRNA (pseudouridine(1915)-N(3))-methyltransferase RlmH [Gemmatimonadaceae bacterium]